MSTGLTPPGPSLGGPPEPVPAPEHAWPDRTAPSSSPSRSSAHQPRRAPATIALILGLGSLFGFFAPTVSVVAIVLGVVLAITALVRSADGRNHGIARSIVALCLCTVSALLLVGGALATAFGPERPDEARASDPLHRELDTDDGVIQTAELQVGDCLPEQLSEGFQLAVRVVPCAGAHRGEVYAAFELDGEDFPGLEQVIRLADDGCLTRTPDVLAARPFRTSQIYFLYPQNASAFAHDRSVQCLVEHDRRTRGSIADVRLGASGRG